MKEMTAPISNREEETDDLEEEGRIVENVLKQARRDSIQGTLGKFEVIQAHGQFTSKGKAKYKGTDAGKWGGSPVTP